MKKIKKNNKIEYWNYYNNCNQSYHSNSFNNWIEIEITVAKK